jgi:hypothetical protein
MMTIVLRQVMMQLVKGVRFNAQDKKDRREKESSRESGAQDPQGLQALDGQRRRHASQDVQDHAGLEDRQGSEADQVFRTDKSARSRSEEESREGPHEISEESRAPADDTPQEVNRPRSVAYFVGPLFGGPIFSRQLDTTHPIPDISRRLMFD